MNGSRMRMKLPEEKYHIGFQLNGVRAPAAERVGAGPPKGKGGGGFNIPQAEPFGINH